ncbi:phosphotransferase [Erythrobacter sp. THAF29]|uniref:phosphotransferase n=1 Tax=Erythrobacter sp. THAF29 TaxID=2587851 RepID=UPI0012680630|nr:phosphotransferase [Erythrobacter sp. THAF29]QFT76675.1 Putative aminoglycoside phosphotransferase [Erythrobacter sp. THAF29]
MGDTTPDQLIEGLARVCSRAGLPPPSDLMRLTGGATMESWRFSAGEDQFVLRRAPSLAFMEDRPYGHDTEAAVIEAARAAGVTAPEVVAVLGPEDGIGSGFVMRALPGTPNPKEILEFDGADALLKQAARDLARIHSLGPGDVPEAVPVMDYREAIADLRQQFEEAGGDRPIIALGLKWMEDNCPDPLEPVLVHGDYRMGNLLAEGSRLTGVLDWELAHFGDRHEDLAFGCMAVWRFHRYDRPALGLGSLEDYFRAYEAEAGVKVDRERFRYWLIHRTVWWALGCLKMAKIWRSGEDRMLERVVISRRTSEQELDLLMLLEEDLPEKLLYQSPIDELVRETELGEAHVTEMATAVSEWLGTVKEKMVGHDRFQLAVARNALGMIAREVGPTYGDYFQCREILAGELTLLSGFPADDDDDYLHELRLEICDRVRVDSPKYPALRAALKKWTGEG